MSHNSEAEWEDDDPGHIRTMLAVLLGNVFDDFTSYGAGQSDADTLRSKIATNCLGMVGLGAAGWFLNSAYFMIFVAFREFQASSIRGKIFVELLKRDVAWFEAQKEGSGAFLSGIQACDSNIHDLQSATSQPLGLVLQYGCRSLASLILALVISWKLALVTLAGIPLFSSIIAYLSTRMKASITAQQVELTHVSKIANNAIASIDTVKCLNGQSFELKNFASRVEQAAIHYLKQARLNSIQIAMIRWMMFGMFVQGFWYGSSLTRSGKISSGDVITTFWACTTAAQSIEQVLPQMIVMEKGKVASFILKRMIRERAKDAIGSELNARNVRSESFHIFFPAEETTFVIGKSGSGKSTLGQLLMRFYLPTSGQILIDGHSIESLDINWIRNNITLLEQRSVLFNDSVLQNFMFGRHDSESISKRDIEDSIELAMLQNTIGGLPRGIDTSVGPGGSFLSGGQRQRVAIARAGLRDTPILILDEPTSALDQTNRVAVMKAIRRWRRRKTTIIITHDMSQISESDFVYILEHGSIMQSGFRHELQNRAGCEKYFSSSTKAGASSSNQHIAGNRNSPPSTLSSPQLKNVYFRYPSQPDTLVLRNVSLTISRNSCTAIVGRSGSGKSTIASLLLALYESPESRSHEPTVMLGGRDIQLLHVPLLRSQISIVSQQPTIFPGSIHAIITYGIKSNAPMASMESVRTAANAAGIDEFIMSLPKGYWTVIGDGGIGLSGGQKQRIVIARALLRHPQILILDEATSSLDPAGAEVVRQTIQRLVSLRRDLTVIIITHAREMNQIADHVVVLDQGFVVEDGPYDALAERVGGRLYELMNDPPDGGA
ncbi:uncharacterized protein N7483_005891 [Penicillium malachiteum]|uniref:uncharacterized protein n=1 Tax=Penicillium malachiteum TaxID=1324776 RepID=UPI0025489ED9|nr:uncharacterized protein N7483_005891 [Penicillium malachiteum]KAJ5731383.1 hypothetical protein N7483_005891 [Penicillium malachiteum]